MSCIWFILLGFLHTVRLTGTQYLSGQNDSVNQTRADISDVSVTKNAVVESALNSGNKVVVSDTTTHAQWRRNKNVEANSTHKSSSLEKTATKFTHYFDIYEKLRQFTSHLTPAVRSGLEQLLDSKSNKEPTKPFTTVKYVINSSTEQNLVRNDLKTNENSQSLVDLEKTYGVGHTKKNSFGQNLVEVSGLQMKSNYRSEYEPIHKFSVPEDSETDAETMKLKPEILPTISKLSYTTFPQEGGISGFIFDFSAKCPPGREDDGHGNCREVFPYSHSVIINDPMYSSPIKTSTRSHSSTADDRRRLTDILTDNREERLSEPLVLNHPTSLDDFEDKEMYMESVT